MSEIAITFTLENKKVKSSIPTNSELFKIYAFCARTFECGIFILKYNNINLNFLNKNMQLSSIFNSNQPDYDITIYSIQKENQLIKELSNVASSDIVINKGSLSTLIQSSTNKQRIDKAAIQSYILKSNYLNSFYLILSISNIKHLELSYLQLESLDEANSQYQMPFISLIQELSVYNKDSMSPNQIKLQDINIQYLKLQNVQVIQLTNVFIEFQTELTHLRKIIKHNSYGLTKGINYSKISSIELLYQKQDEMMTFLKFLNKKITQLTSIRIIFDSIDLTNSLNIIELLSNQVFSVSNKIYFNLKAKLSISDDSNNTLTNEVNEEQLSPIEITSILNKIKELKLRPYTVFNEKHLDFFKGKLINMSLFKLSNHNIADNSHFDDFFRSNNVNGQLSYIDIGSNNIMQSYGDKVYRIFSFNDSIFNTNVFSSFSPRKISMITLPYLEYNKKAKSITLLGDIIPSAIDESFYLFIKHILFSLDTISALTIKSFNESSSDFLNKIIINLLNVISSPKVNKLTLSLVTITQILIDKFSFIFMNSASTLSKLVIDDVSFLDEETEYLFYSILFQVDYSCLSKVTFRNMSIEDNTAMLLNENNIIALAGNVSLESIDPIANIESLLLETRLIGIELKNVDIPQDVLEKLLEKNEDVLESLSVDLSYDVVEILQKFSFPNLRKLKLYNNCFEVNKKKRNLFVTRRSWHMQRLCKLKINEDIKDDKNKIISAYKYLSDLS